MKKYDVCKTTKEIDIHSSLMVMRAFKAHYMNDVAAAMLNGHTAVVKAPAGCTSKVQPLGLCINKPFISILWQYWKDHVVKAVKVAQDEPNNSPNFKLSSPTRQDIVNWVHRGYVFLKERNVMIQRFF